MNQSNNENAKVTTVIGGQGSGKSYATIALAKKYIQIRNMSVLIIDVKDERVFQEFTRVSYETGKQIKGDWDKTREERAQGKIFVKNGTKYRNGIITANKPHIYRLVCQHSNGIPFNKVEIIEMLLTVSQYYRNGMLLLEEMNSYFRGTLPDEFYSFFTNVRKSGVDLLLHFQGIGDVYPSVWRNTKILRLHNTYDSFSEGYLKQKAAAKYPLMQIAENIVQAYSERTAEAKDELVGSKTKQEIALILKKHKLKIGEVFFFCYVDFDRKKISGDFTKQEFNEAVKKYLWDNDREVKSLMKVKEKGQKIFKYEEEAIQNLIETKYSKLIS